MLVGARFRLPGRKGSRQERAKIGISSKRLRFLLRLGEELTSDATEDGTGLVAVCCPIASATAFEEPEPVTVGEARVGDIFV